MSKVEVINNLCFTIVEHQSAEAPAISDVSPGEALVMAAQKGDREAFTQLYHAYAPVVHGILLARIPRAEVADLVQDVFLQAFKKLHALRNVNTFGAWLATITRNRAMDFHRRSRAAEELTEEDVGRSPAEVEAEGILAVIRRLPETYRETLVLRLVEELTGAEIAARTGLTPASVRVNLHRGMKLLRKELGEKYE